MGTDAKETNRPRASGGRAAAWAGFAVVAVLPLVLGVVGYFRPVLRGEAVSRMWGDVPFASYQLARAGELGGRWWTIADDDRMGAPYQTEAAKNPSLYEGIDVMLLAALASRLATLSPARHYDLAILAVLAANGWIAAWLVKRQTRSWLWAALAVALITLNYPTEWRITQGHNHLFKYGWALAAVAAFSAYLNAPGWRRGAVLGLAVSWQFQGSFYQGFLLGLGLAAWWLGSVISGRVGRRHVAGAVAAGLAFGLTAVVYVYPVVTVAKATLLTDGFFQRTKREVWAFGSELWQFVVPPSSPAATKYINEVGHKMPAFHYEGWAFPGYTVLLAVGLYLAARSRGWRPRVSDPKALNLWLGLAAVFVVLSLSGGPSLYLFEVFPTFRCFGRAALLAMALGCVATPVIAHALIGSLRSRGLRVAATVAVVALAAFDGYSAVKTVPDFGPEANRPSAWTAWLRRQPDGVNLAAFAPLVEPLYPYYSWGSDAFRDRPGPGHAILNGANFHLLEADLALLGATYERMNPAALRFVVSLGYEALAYDQAYLDRNPWLRSERGLRLVETREGWSIYRATSELTRYPTTTPEALLAAQPPQPIAREVPPGCWVTGELKVGGDVVVARGGQVFAAWINARGKVAETRRRVLFQHVFGDGMPAFSVVSPGTPGPHRLVFLDRKGRRLAETLYVVNPALRTLGTPVAGETHDIALRPITGPSSPPGRVRIAVQNHTPYFLQAQANHWYLPPSVRPHPGFGLPFEGSLFLEVGAEPGGLWNKSPLLLPRDVGPGEQIELDLPPEMFTASAFGGLAGLTPRIRTGQGPIDEPTGDSDRIGARSAEGKRVR